MAYNPYSAINAIYNYKNEWDSSNKAGDTDKKNKAAENAQVFYKQLRDNGYSDVADQLSAVDVTGAKYILDQYSTKNSGVDNQAYSTTMQNAVDKNNKFASYIDSDRSDVQGKYNDIYNYANQDITKTDEYKSTFNAMMGKYDLSALQGRDNAVASGSASNGGNIDSYSAANAMRQQAAITAQGQQIAHQAGLDAYNARVSNVSNILNNLGVYNDSTYSAMNETVNNDRNIANDYFNNAETAKNNETARLVEQANVTGYTPTEWTIKNDDVYKTYLNEDGTFKKEMENVDIQALINSAKKSGDTETAKKLAVVRAKKMLGNWKEFGQYAGTGDISYMSPQITEARRESEQNNATALKTLASETEIANKELDTKKAISDSTLATEKAISDSTLATEKYIADANNKNTLDQIELTALYSQAATGQLTDEHKEQIAKTVNSKFKDAIGKDMVAQIGGEYFTNDENVGVIARYLMSQSGSPDLVASVMNQMFGTPEDKVKEALSKSNVYEWEDSYNPAKYTGTSQTPYEKYYNTGFR